MVNITEFFKQEKKGGTQKRKANDDTAPPSKKARPIPKQEIIDLDDEEYNDDDDVIMDSIPKAKPKATPKKPATHKKTTTTTTSSSKSKVKSATDILKEIPDVTLPETEETGAFDFRAAMANKNETVVTDITLPPAQPNCLTGLTIVFTGQMPHIARDFAEQTAQKYGAKVTKSISGKTSLVVLGAEAGPSKVKKIKEKNIKCIDEDGFIQLLSSMPADGGSGDAAKNAKKKRELEERKSIEEAEEAMKKEAELERRRKETLKIQMEKDKNRSEPSQNFVPQVQELDPKDQLWTVKYAPSELSQLCGNKGQVKKLQTWLENWFDFKHKNFKVSEKDDPGNYRAILISGPPGIGKTSAAHLVAKSLGYDILEKNASDVRSKSLLNSQVKSLLNNTSVVGYFKNRDDPNANQNNKKFCLIMDEVDGMSSGDHGGAGALSAFCKITEMPMILICNDKSLPKMRTFDRVTYDLPFRRPQENEVKSRLMTIAFREGIKLDPTYIGQLVQATSNDIRQMINLLCTVSKTQKNINSDNMEAVSKSWKKQVILKPFDITQRILSSTIWLSKNHSLDDKLNLYFNDIDFAPLMIQENYLNTKPRSDQNHKSHLELVAEASDDISISDSINSLIRSSEQQWSLLPFHGIMSTVKPSFEVAGQITGRLNFSAWLGQNSKQLKYQRILQELQYHTRIKTSTTKQELRLDYLNPLWNKMSYPIKYQGDLGIDATIDTMDEYYLTKEDFDSIGELLRAELKLDSRTKAAFTRKYNSKIHPTVIYKTGNSLTNGGRKQAKEKVDYEDVVDDDMEDVPDEENENDDKIDSKKDKLIKVKEKGGATKRKTPAKSSSVKAPSRERAKK
ncbi:unnamed protein product [Candida verbasci]|uniref:Replication factor C subunit 1 n=1 Tax=Candida verbasci TaxID=1227364 RepID=A0A9W4TS88_9ASCO|nr:unnamed protein product [Candida verbasci]